MSSTDIADPSSVNSLTLVTSPHEVPADVLPSAGQSESTLTGFAPGSTYAPPTLPAKKKRATWSKPPKDTKVYKVVMRYIAMRASGMTRAEIAPLLNITTNTLKTYIHRAHKLGYLNMDSFKGDPDEQLDVILKDKTVRNIDELLDARDKDVTLEVAKGIGMLKHHQVVKGDTGAQTMIALRVDVQMPPNPQHSAISIRPGTVGGSFARGVPMDAEIVDSEEGQH